MGLMAEPTPVWTPLDVADWQAGDYVREPELLELLQNLYHIASVHNHDGGTADGGVLVLADPLGLMFYGPAAAG